MSLQRFLKRVGTRIPAVLAACPWKFRREGREQVKKRPSQYDDVVHSRVQNNDLAAVTQAW